MEPGTRAWPSFTAVAVWANAGASRSSGLTEVCSSNPMVVLHRHVSGVRVE